MTRRTWRTFWYAFILSVCLFGLCMSCFVIECNIRRISGGAADFGVRYSLPDGRLQVDADNRPVTIDERVEMVMSPPMRFMLALWRRQNRLVARLWE